MLLLAKKGVKEAIHISFVWIRPMPLLHCLVAAGTKGGFKKANHISFVGESIGVDLFGRELGLFVPKLYFFLSFFGDWLNAYQPCMLLLGLSGI